MTPTCTRRPDPDLPPLRADLHVHSYHSGYAAHLTFSARRDCYSAPEEIYRVAKARGMDLVTITDHDSIDGCLEFLSRHPDAPDFIMGEEIECTLPARTRGEAASPSIRIHIGVLGMTERIHRDMQPLRRNVYEVRRVPARSRTCSSRSTICSISTVGRWARSSTWTRCFRLFPALETRNGAMLPRPQRV